VPLRVVQPELAAGLQEHVAAAARCQPHPAWDPSAGSRPGRACTHIAVCCCPVRAVQASRFLSLLGSYSAGMAEEEAPPPVAGVGRQPARSCDSAAGAGEALQMLRGAAGGGAGTPSSRPTQPLRPRSAPQTRDPRAGSASFQRKHGRKTPQLDEDKRSPGSAAKCVAGMVTPDHQQQPAEAAAAKRARH
jgi:hypothetical protein